MDILEWFISARNQFIYFAICLSIPSIVLYIAEIVTILRHKQFHNSFFALFIIRAIPLSDLLYLLDSFYCFRLTVLFGTALFPLYSLLPNWMIGLSFFFTGYTFQANNLATVFILLNRLTAIAVPLRHATLWRRFLPLVSIVVFGVPMCTNWIMFRMNGILQMENDHQSNGSSATGGTGGFFLYEAGEAPFTNLLALFDALFALLFMALCSAINICVFVAYKANAKPPKNGTTGDRIERKLLAYALVTFAGHALIACLMIGI